ncbi:MAG: hypothetical protein KDA24_01845 [Deltaproteobacteria bacterium]|nr:hypothetical protein [Deltaproteobacteria bacterium]
MTPRHGLALVSVLCALLFVGLFGRAIDARSVSLAECAARPASCEGRELYLGFTRVVAAEGDTVSLRSWMGPVQVTPWLPDEPLPSPGTIISVVGYHGGGLVVVPELVKEHPYRRFKEVTGIAMLGAWLLALGFWVLRRWRHRPSHA